ncbi:MAG: pentapeptide repeat-containing protein [Roseivirga sp.]
MSDYNEQTFTSQDFAEANLRGNYYDECQFANCDFTNADFGQASFENCSFESCNLDRIKVVNTKWQEVNFKACRMSGIDFEDISKMLFSASFENCQLSYSHFKDLKIPKTRFLNCEIKECDFVESDLSGSWFTGSSLSGSNFERCNLSKADFRDAHDYRFDPWNNQIKKARFSSPEVLSLLHQFDIEIG